MSLKDSFAFISELLLISLSLATVHAAFTTLADRAFHVLRQLQHFDQISKLLHGQRIVVDTEVCQEQSAERSTV